MSQNKNLETQKMTFLDPFSDSALGIFFRDISRSQLKTPPIRYLIRYFFTGPARFVITCCKMKWPRGTLCPKKGQNPIFERFIFSISENHLFLMKVVWYQRVPSGTVLPTLRQSRTPYTT